MRCAKYKLKRDVSRGADLLQTLKSRLVAGFSGTGLVYFW
jgi:hypothetical protein